MKLIWTVLFATAAVCLSGSLGGEEAMAWVDYPPSCAFAEELGYKHWGWNAICRNDLRMIAEGYK